MTKFLMIQIKLVSISQFLEYYHSMQLLVFRISSETLLSNHLAYKYNDNDVTKCIMRYLHNDRSKILLNIHEVFYRPKKLSLLSQRLSYQSRLT